MKKETRVNKLLQKLSDWQKTVPGLITFILSGSLLASWFITQAIDSGSLLDYSVAVLLLVLVVQDVVRLIQKVLARLRTKGKQRD
jgi:hypothetical protein